MSKVVGLPNNSYKTITNKRGFASGFVNCKKVHSTHSRKWSSLPMIDGCLRVLRLFPPLKTGCHNIAEILLKVALNTIKIKSNHKIVFPNHVLKVCPTMTVIIDFWSTAHYWQKNGPIFRDFSIVILFQMHCVTSVKVF